MREKNGQRKGVHTLRVLSCQGDESIEWDADAAAAGDPEAKAAVAEAERIFAEVRARGGAAYRVGQRRAVKRIHAFDPAHKQIVLIPPIVGG